MSRELSDAELNVILDVGPVAVTSLYASHLRILENVEKELENGKTSEEILLKVVLHLDFVLESCREMLNYAQENEIS